MKVLVKSECIELVGICLSRLTNDLHPCSKDDKSIESTWYVIWELNDNKWFFGVVTQRKRKQSFRLPYKISAT